MALASIRFNKIIGISIGSLHIISNFSMETSCEQQLLLLNNFLQKPRFFFSSQWGTMQEKVDAMAQEEKLLAH